MGYNKGVPRFRRPVMNFKRITVSILCLISLALNSGCLRTKTFKEACLDGNKGLAKPKYQWIPAKASEVPLFGNPDNYGDCSASIGVRGSIQ